MPFSIAFIVDAATRNLAACVVLITLRILAACVVLVAILVACIVLTTLRILVAWVALLPACVGGQDCASRPKTSMLETLQFSSVQFSCSSQAMVDG